ncbi:hypothetical protein SLEP1_g14377 [Rubroshorea leprosula]|uniref:Metallothionein n=1 Tax=Rubroshorea leprosula TaxID=152421 RepID=A0AAV5ITA4_9ROSI|nr:hypothetical protein SLEP1_g14377 [Rubroshorea leprosula]
MHIKFECNWGLVTCCECEDCKAGGVFSTGCSSEAC